MGMAGGDGPADDAESIATVHAALDAGVTFLDAGDFYGHGHTEMLLKDALEGGRRERAFIAIKFGAQRSRRRQVHGRRQPARIGEEFPGLFAQAPRHGLHRLYQPARLDPEVPIEDTIGAIAEMVKAGFVRHIGLSEVGVKTIRRAARGASDRGAADRVLADEPRHRGSRFCRRSASSASRWWPMACWRAG